MEPEGPLPCWQVPATCLYPEPHQSGPRPPSHCVKIHLNIILAFTPASSKWSLSLRFPHQNFLYTSLSHTCYMPRPSHYSRFDHPNSICEEYRSFSSSVWGFLHSPVTSWTQIFSTSHQWRHNLCIQKHPALYILTAIQEQNIVKVLCLLVWEYSLCIST
jgi:hypothetical protein